MESNSKRGASSSSNWSLHSIRTSNELLSVSGDISSQPSNMQSDSHHSSPITSFEAADAEPGVMKPNPADFWVSSDLILDSSKEYSIVQETACKYIPQCDFSSAMAPWQPYKQPELSPYLNYDGVMDLSDDLGRIGYMSPYSGQDNYMGFSADINASCEGAGCESWGASAICRQASGEGSLTELTNLWIQDDNFTIVM